MKPGQNDYYVLKFGPGTMLIPGARLLFLPICPRGTFIPWHTLIPKHRVSDQEKLL